MPKACVYQILVTVCACWTSSGLSLAQEENSLDTEESVDNSNSSSPAVEGGIPEAIAKSLKLLEKASAGSAEHRVCFTCHGQAMPVLAFTQAQQSGFDVDEENFSQQIEHTFAHLRRGRKDYAQGKGQGGGVDTAGYAMWTLEDGEHPRDEVTDAVVTYLLEKQRERGNWKTSSNRPPSEASNFTTTYLALRALDAFADESLQADIAESKRKAASWLAQAEPKDTEDRVFALLSTSYIDASEELVGNLISELKDGQREDGGWAQKDDMESDAYATGSVLYALYHSEGFETDEESVPWLENGIDFLLNSQLDDGSWKVVSRSKPFQKYFETGFPHGKDQFISTSATAWATLALLYAAE